MTEPSLVERHVPVTTPISIDRTVALLSGIMTLLSLLRIPDRLGWSVDTTAAVLGFGLAAMAGVRAWWEGRLLSKGGSVVDPIAVIVSAILGLVGLLHVPSSMEFTPALVTGLVTSALTTAASWRDSMRRRAAAKAA